MLLKKRGGTLEFRGPSPQVLKTSGKGAEGSLWWSGSDPNHFREGCKALTTTEQKREGSEVFLSCPLPRGLSCDEGQVWPRAPNQSLTAEKSQMAVGTPKGIMLIWKEVVLEA